MARKRLSENEKAYNKELRRIKSFIKRAEQRGYRFETGAIPQKPKKVTQASVRRLQKLTPTVLYKKSTAISEETGKVITGTQRRKEEQAEARQRRKLNKKIIQEAIQEQYDFVRDYEEERQRRFEEERRRKDEEEKKRLENDKIYREVFTAGQITYDNIIEMIDNLDYERKGYGYNLLKQLHKAMGEVGRDKFMYSIGVQSSLVERLSHAILYYIDKSVHDSDMLELMEIIKGETLTPEEIKTYQEILDSSEDYG